MKLFDELQEQMNKLGYRSESNRLIDGRMVNVRRFMCKNKNHVEIKLSMPTKDNLNFVIDYCLFIEKSKVYSGHIFVNINQYDSSDLMMFLSALIDMI